MNTELAELMRGRYVALDGPDGCGKSTVARRFCTELVSLGVPAKVVREPGGTFWGEQIRAVLLHADASSQPALEPVAEVMLFMAARAQMCRENIAPWRDAGKTVVGDRCVASSFAYQGHAGGLGWNPVMDLYHVAVPLALRPGLIVILDVDVQVGAIRRKQSRLGADNIEARGLSYHQRVREGYQKFAQVFSTTTRLVDASDPLDDVYASVCRSVEMWFRGQ